MLFSHIKKLIASNKFQVTVTGDDNPQEGPRLAIINPIPSRQPTYNYSILETEPSRHHHLIPHHFTCLRCTVVNMGNQRILRGVTVATFIPGFALCLAHGIASQEPLPAVGIIPMFFSVVLGSVMLAVTSKGQPLKLKQRARADNDPENFLDPSLDDEDDNDELHVKHPILLFFADSTLATLHMLLLVLTWISLGGWHQYYYNHAFTVLATYATVPMLTDL